MQALQLAVTPNMSPKRLGGPSGSEAWQPLLDQAVTRQRRQCRQWQPNRQQQELGLGKRKHARLSRR